MPFLEGTVPPPDTFHSQGCFDIVGMVRADSRRPVEWVQSAQRFADRLVNGETGAKGDIDDLKELGPDRVWMAIGPLPGNSGFGSAICGNRRETPEPSPTGGSGGPAPSCNPNKPACVTPAPTVSTAPAALSPPSLPPISGGALVPIFGLPAVVGAASFAWRQLHRRRRSRR
jgi:hypothetical protein